MDLEAPGTVPWRGGEEAAAAETMKAKERRHPAVGLLGVRAGRQSGRRPDFFFKKYNSTDQYL
jgi:hypothetical protein